MGTIAAELSGPREAEGATCRSPLEEMTSLMTERLSYFHRIALRRLDNHADAEDAVQNAFLSAWKNLEKFKGTAQMSTWLTVIVMNSARMVRRKGSRVLHIPLEGEDSDPEIFRLSEILRDKGPDPEAQVRRRELQHRLSQLSLHLSPPLREVVQLCSVDGLSNREAAEALGLTVSAVKTRAARAREQLKFLDESYPAKIDGTRNPRRRRRKKASVRTS